MLSNNGSLVTISPTVQSSCGQRLGHARITTFTGGAGYIAPPFIIISNGGGTGATAIAQINPATGTVTNVLITCPGINYTNTPAFLFSGGGATTQATVTAAALAANANGPLTFTGNGVIALTGGSSYTNVTVINQTQLLQLSGGGSISHSFAILVTNSGTFGPFPLSSFILSPRPAIRGRWWRLDQLPNL